jgi:hypothetical protein
MTKLLKTISYIDFRNLKRLILSFYNYVGKDKRYTYLRGNCNAKINNIEPLAFIELSGLK